MKQCLHANWYLRLGDGEVPDDFDVGVGSREQVSGIPGAKVERNVHGQYLVRGRLFDPKSKPKTFNQVQCKLMFNKFWQNGVPTRDSFLR